LSIDRTDDKYCYEHTDIDVGREGIHEKRFGIWRLHLAVWVLVGFRYDAFSANFTRATSAVGPGLWNMFHT